MSVDFQQYHRFIEELLTLLEEKQPSLEADTKALKSRISTKILEQWHPEVLTVHQRYFQAFAEEHHIASWLPYFVAEHAIRPFLQRATAEIRDELKKADVHGCCPACGEAPRLAIINKKGRKEVTCPRCHYAWEVKKLTVPIAAVRNLENWKSSRLKRMIVRRFMFVMTATAIQR